MNELELRPIALNLDRQRALSIDWEAGGSTVIPLATLRAACPCAECRARRDATPKAGQGLPVIGGQADLSQQVTADSAELVGHYALRIRWKDGHDTGIYDFELLRSLGDRPGA